VLIYEDIDVSANMLSPFEMLKVFFFFAVKLEANFSSKTSISELNGDKMQETTF